MPPSQKPFDPISTVTGKKKLLPGELGVVLEFVDGDEAGRQVPLLFEQTVLGRKEGDILVRDIKVSATHLTIEYRAGFFRVIDLGSSNGTFVGGKRVKEKQIQPGQEVRMGDCAFRLKLDPALAESLAGARPAATTRAKSGLSDLIDREFIHSDEKTVRAEATSEDQKEARLQIRLRVALGPDRGKNFAFFESSVIIGRLNADVPLSDPDVSRKHAVLERGEGGQVILRDLASANGTSVNHRRVANCVLAPNDRIGVGSTTILFLGVERL